MYEKFRSEVLSHLDDLDAEMLKRIAKAMDMAAQNYAVNEASVFARERFKQVVGSTQRLMQAAFMQRISGVSYSAILPANKNRQVGIAVVRMGIKMKIKASDLIAMFELMANEHWAYEWGAAREGCVDCSGAFVYAYKVLGGLSIAHGSNTIARKHCGAMVPASEAKPGYAMFRWREDGEPERYEKDGMDDFYHIGLKGRNGKVLNAKSTAAGFVESPDSGWKYAAPLLDVEYETTTEEGEPMEEDVTVLYRAQVVTKTDPLNLREQPAAGSRKIGELPKGCMVDVLDTAVNAGWWRVRYGALVGYASKAYLARVWEEESVEMDRESVNNAVAESIDATTLVREDGDGVVTLIGRWRVAED